jgi:hypothetical protein
MTSQPNTRDLYLPNRLIDNLVGALVLTLSIPRSLCTVGRQRWHSLFHNPLLPKTRSKSSTTKASLSPAAYLFLLSSLPPKRECRQASLAL